jgi:FKBP-type peptidyl-prolyl cis-trans isomerase SlyD
MALALSFPGSAGIIPPSSATRTGPGSEPARPRSPGLAPLPTQVHPMSEPTTGETRVIDQRVMANKVVHITYFITDGSGEQIERSDIPVGYVHGGHSELLPKIEQALEGHKVGDSIDVRVDPLEGFGPHQPELTYTDDIANVPPELRQLGAQVEMQNDRGESKTFTVTRIQDGKLTVDGNHPLAGKTVTFSVTVIDVRDATPEETRNGMPAEGQFGMPIQ